MIKQEKRNAYLRNWRKTDVCRKYQKKYQKEYRKNNKERVEGYLKKYRKNNREKLLDGYRKYYSKNAESRKKYAKEYRRKKIGIDNLYDKKNHLRYRSRRLEHNREYRRANFESIHRYRVKHRLEVMAVLGEVCVKCGFTDLRALQIDHVNGGGSKIRRENGFSGYYQGILKAVKEGSKEYQILCANCNQIKKYTDKEYHKGKQS